MPSGECLSELSKKLQEGWTLLNQHCPMPGCGTPLFKDLNGAVYCVKCQMFCITQAEAQSLGAAEGNAPTAPQGGSSLLDPATTKTDRDISSSAQELTATASKQKARAAAETRMGENLLLGWTMLADECPTAGCCFPLMRDRERNITCVACGGNGTATESSQAPARVTDDAPSRSPAAGATGAASTADVTLPPAAPARSESKVESSVGVLSKEEFAVVRKKRDALSASLGRYMLQGWSLLDRTCPRKDCEPGTPLLKDRSTGIFFCAGCDTRMCEGEQGTLVDVESTASSATALPVKRNSSGENRNLPPPLVEAHVPVPKAEPMQVESEYELAERARLRKQAAREQGKGALSASAGLAERLLQGWAMLSSACPEPGCHSPLMRDRDGREVCVSCNTQPIAAETDSSTTPEQAAGDLLGETGTEEGYEENADEDEAMLDHRVGRAYTEKRMAELTDRVTAGPSAVHLDVIDHVRVKNQALDTLYRALDASQRRLRACSGGSVDVEESARQADLIVKLAVATRAVFDLPTGTAEG